MNKSIVIRPAQTHAAEQTTLALWLELFRLSQVLRCLCEFTNPLHLTFRDVLCHQNKGTAEEV